MSNTSTMEDNAEGIHALASAAEIFWQTLSELTKIDANIAEQQAVRAVKLRELETAKLNVGAKLIALRMPIEGYYDMYDAAQQQTLNVEKPQGE